MGARGAGGRASHREGGGRHSGTTGVQPARRPPLPRRGWVRTGQHGRAAVLGRVLLPLRHERAVGLRLVGTQRLPLFLQPVLVPQVVLHVGLEGRAQSARGAGQRGPARGRLLRGVGGTGGGRAHIAPACARRELVRRPGQDTDQPREGRQRAALRFCFPGQKCLWPVHLRRSLGGGDTLTRTSPPWLVWNDWGTRTCTRHTRSDGPTKTGWKTCPARSKRGWEPSGSSLHGL